MVQNSSVILVDTWEPESDDHKVLYDGKLVIIPFHKIFDRDVSRLNNFVIKKESYVKQLKHFCKYINYFIKFYDPEDELLLGYFKLKSIIDNKHTSMKLKPFIRAVYRILFTETMKDKITQMVEDNYYVPLRSRKDVYPESLEFTEEHARLMMRISVCIKLMVPIVFHYMNTNNLNKEIPLFTFYQPLFEMFDDEVDIYRKLDITARTRVSQNYRLNKFIWDQREIMGTDQLIYMDSLLKDNIISETMAKYEFSKNIVAFNSVVIDRQLSYFLMEPYKHNMVELSHKKDPEGLSGLDKLEMNSAKIDESLIILSAVNIKETIKKLRKAMKLEITDEELDYYRDHYSINKFQVQLVYYYYAKYFGGYRDLNMLNRKQYIKLLVMLKKRLQYQGMVYLPQILTGNVSTKMNRRVIQNQKFVTKIENSSVYQELIQNKFSALEVDPKTQKFIMGLLSTMLNTPFMAVDFNNQDNLGERIEIHNPDILSDEFLSFLNQI